MALMSKEKFLRVSRKRAFAARDSCTVVAHRAHLHAPHHPRTGTPGGSAKSHLLHKYAQLSHHFLHK